jgi:hypothetical protein
VTFEWIFCNEQLTDILKRWISNVATFEKVREQNSTGETNTGKKYGKRVRKKEYGKRVRAVEYGDGQIIICGGSMRIGPLRMLDRKRPCSEVCSAHAHPEVAQYPPKWGLFHRK